MKEILEPGGFVLDIFWKNFVLEKIEIFSKKGGPCVLSYKEKEIIIQTKEEGLYMIKGSEI